VKNILRLKSLLPLYGCTNSGQHQRSMPLSTIGSGGAIITLGGSQATFELNHLQSLRNDQSRSMDYGDITLKFKNSSQVAILGTDRLNSIT
jgi:hypothetical protein